LIIQINQNGKANIEKMLRFFPTSPVTMNIKINDSTFGYFIDNEIQCLLISEFQNKNVKTKLFTVNGIIPTEIFDLLCKLCSTRAITATTHTIEIVGSNEPCITLGWETSRLGAFTKMKQFYHNASWITLRAEIDYGI
jgi:hypothetical protein